ncbi:nuclear transport factor 2 family protein [Caulobacter segnis]
MLTDDVEWPDEVECGVLTGREAVRIYFTDVTAPLRALLRADQPHTDAEGRVSVLSRQTVASAADGSLWSSTRVTHRFTLRDGQIARMEAEQDVQAVTFPGIADLLADCTRRSTRAT